MVRRKCQIDEWSGVLASSGIPQLRRNDMRSRAAPSAYDEQDRRKEESMAA